jgi:hypothetical protein
LISSPTVFHNVASRIPDRDFLSIPDLRSKRGGEKFFLFSTGIAATLGLIQPTPEVGNFFILLRPLFFIVENSVPDLDPFVRGTGTDPDPSIIKQKK